MRRDEKVFILSNDNLMLLLLTRIFQKNKYDCSGMMSYAFDISIFDNINFDLFVIDMDEMRFRELNIVQHLRFLSGVPVIVSTTSTKFFDEFRKIKNVSVLYKPYDIKIIREEAERLLWLRKQTKN